MMEAYRHLLPRRGFVIDCGGFQAAVGLLSSVSTELRPQTDNWIRRCLKLCMDLDELLGPSELLALHT